MGLRLAGRIVLLGMVVGMERCTFASTRRDLFQRLPKRIQVKYAKQDQHQGYRKLHSKAKPRGNHQSEENDRSAYQQNRERVTNSPENPNERRSIKIPLASDDGCDGDDVIRIGRMPSPQEESQRQNSEKIDHTVKPLTPIAPR